MAITSVGYAGSITDDNWRRMATAAIGSLYGVDDYASWKVSTGVGDRASRIAAGGGFGLGVRDVSDANVTLNHASVPSGQRWDLIVAHRDWNAGTTTFTIIQGSSVKALPTRATGYGTTNDQPIALVRIAAGQAVVQEIVDLRCIPGDGGLVAFNDLARSYLDRVGTRVLINGVEWNRTVNTLGSPTWVSSATGEPERFEGRFRRSDGQQIINSGQTLMKWQTVSANTLEANATANDTGAVVVLPAGLHMVTATVKASVGATNYSQLVVTVSGGSIIASDEGEYQTPPGYYEMGATRVVYSDGPMTVGVWVQSNNPGAMREDGFLRAFRMK